MHPQPPRRTTHVAGSPRSMLVYDRWGGFGRPVLLLHGLLFDRTMWWPLAAELAPAACTVVAPDLPGHGDSPGREDCRLDDIARELAALVHRLGLHRAPVVVGHAASAPLAAAFAESYATHGLLTVDEPPSGTADVAGLVAAAGVDRVPEILRPYCRPRHDAALLEAYAGWLRHPHPRRTEPALAGRAASRPLPDGPFAPLTDPEGFAARLRSLL
jgi:pimeloyl-ACP methyl ester carboxylesterase